MFRIVVAWLALGLPVQAVAIDVADLAPDCLHTLASASAIPMPAMQGKAVIIDFWASWCPPCKRAMPYLETLYHAHREAGFEIIAVNVDEQRDAAEHFLAVVPITYPVVYDPTGACARGFGVEAMPSTYFIDRTGLVRHVHHGFRERDRETFSARVKELVEE